jgi:peptide/nickel transport system permease protein
MEGQRTGMIGRAAERLGRLLQFARKNPLTALGFATLMVMAAASLLAPVVAPYGPYDSDPARALLAPSREHIFGTDTYGEDIFSRVLYGGRITLVISLLAVLAGLVVGLMLGAVAGYFGGFADEGIMRIMDMFEGFPQFMLAMGVAVAIGPGLITLVAANAVVNVPVYARILRSRMLSVKKSQYASAAVCVGNRWHRVLFVHLLPNCLAPVFVQATLQSGWAILAAAGLSYLGLGMNVPTAEWGAMVQMGTRFMLTGEWWVSFYPGLAIVVAVLAFNLIGDGLQDLLDPHRRY